MSRQSSLAWSVTFEIAIATAQRRDSALCPLEHTSRGYPAGLHLESAKHPPSPVLVALVAFVGVSARAEAHLAEDGTLFVLPRQIDAQDKHAQSQHQG